MTTAELAEIYLNNDRFALVNHTGRMFDKPIHGYHTIALTGMTERIGRHFYSYNWRTAIFDVAAPTSDLYNRTYRWRRP